VTYNAVVYTVGQTFVATSTTLSGSGTVIQIVNLNLPEHTWEEIAAIAAKVLTGEIADYQKSKFTASESNQA
jgi:hypothetical protein